MIENLLVVAQQVGVLFLLMGVGFALAKLGKLSGQVLSQLSFMLMYIVTPCIILDTMQMEHSDEVLASLGLGTLLCVGGYVLYVLVSQLCFRRQDPDRRDTLRFAAIYGNQGFMGFPLIQSMLGEGGLLFAMPSYMMFQVASWTHGVLLMGGRKEVSLKRLVTSPPILATAVGLFLFLTRTNLPYMVGSAVGFLADLNTPLAMVVIGGQMASADLPATFRNRLLYLSAGFKLLLVPAVTALILLPFHLPPLLFAATVILAGTPTAGVTGMFAQQFERDREAAAQTITLSTLLSMLTLPVVAVLAKGAMGL